MESTIISIQEASKLLRLTPQQVRNLCRSNKLPSRKLGPHWLLYKKDVIKYYDNNSCGVAEDRAAYSAQAKSKTNGKPLALSFFSGAMGLDLGLERAGFKVLLTCETDNACRKTILKNRPDIALIGDIREYNAAEIKNTAGLKKTDDIDVVVGGPPCQSFSTAGRRQGFEDERGNLLLKFLDKIIELRPKFAVIENVRGILSAPLKYKPHSERQASQSTIDFEQENGSVLFHVISLLHKAGYGVSFNLYNAANFGSPQIRERVIIICSRDGNKLPYLTPLHSNDAKYGLPGWRTFADAVKGLPKNCTHITFPEKRLKYYSLLKPGQYWRHLPEELQKEALGKSYFSNGGKTGFFRRLSWDKPAPTLVTHPAMPATDLAHPTENRPLSIEEYKRIQEFPDEWLIEGTITEQYRQVGNAVPISLGHAIGDLLIKYLNGDHIINYPGFPYSRYRKTDDVSWIENNTKTQSQPMLSV